MKFLVIFNDGSGSKKNDETVETISGAFTELGADFTIIRLMKGEDVEERCRKEVEKASEVELVVVAAGGDGTVNAVANVCYRRNLIMGLIPLGTFNYFGRKLGLPADVPGAVERIVRGTAQLTGIATINDRVFVIGAGLGLYKKIIESREHDKAIFGRHRLVAFVSGVITLLKKQKSFHLKVSRNGKDVDVRTTMLFVSTNALQMSDLGLKVAEDMDRGLGICVLKEMTKAESLLLLLRQVLGRLNAEKHIIQFCLSRLDVETFRSKVDVVLDGEITTVENPLSFTFHPSGLKVIR